jgi:hypothetical protein
MWLMRLQRQVFCPASVARLNCCGWLGNVEVLGYPIIYLQIKVYCRLRSGPWLSGKLLVFRTCMPTLWSPSKGVTVPALPKENNVAFDVFYRGFGEYYKGDHVKAAIEFDRAYDLEPSLL